MTESRQDREATTASSAVAEDLTGPFQQVLELRQRTEKQLADAGQIRSAALEDASGILGAAREVAVLHEEASQRQSEQLVREARERAVGIVATATEEADQLRAAAEEDAQRALEEARSAAEELMVQIREESTQKLVGDLGSLRERIASLSETADLVLKSLRSGLQDAERMAAESQVIPPDVVSPDEATDLPAQALVTAATATAPEADAVRVSVVAADDPVGSPEAVVEEAVVGETAGTVGMQGVSDVEGKVAAAGDPVSLDEGAIGPQEPPARPLGWLFRTP